MSDSITRRNAIATAAAGTVALSASSTLADDNASLNSMPKAKTGVPGRMVVTVQVVAADDFSPVENVEVQVTHVGRGGDGGYTSHPTDSNGVATLEHGIYEPGPYQIHLRPPADSRFVFTSHQKLHDFLVVQPDGTYFPSVFRIGFVETQHLELRAHRVKHLS